MADDICNAHNEDDDHNAEAPCPSCGTVHGIVALRATAEAVDAVTLDGESYPFLSREAAAIDLAGRALTWVVSQASSTPLDATISTTMLLLDAISLARANFSAWIEDLPEADDSNAADGS